MSFLKQKNMTFFVSRILTAMSTVMLLFLVSTNLHYGSAAYYHYISPSVFITCAVTLFAVLCFIPSQRLINCLLIGITTVYFCVAAFRGADYYFSFGLSFVLCMAVYFFDVGQFHLKLSRTTFWIIIGAMSVAFILWVGIISCMYYWNNGTSCYDMGIFSQMFYYMKEYGQVLTTCERDGLLSHFAVHFSPIYYVLLPFYCLFPTPATLLICQTVLVCSGVIPLLMICKRYNLSNLACIAFAICYLLFPGFLGGCFFHFHENCFLPPLLLWLLYFAEKKSVVCTSVFALLTVMVKEDAPMYVAIISLYFVVTNKNRLLHTIIFVLSVAYFITVTKLMGIFGEGIMTSSRFPEYIHDDGGLMSFVRSVLSNPIFAIQQIFTADKLLFVLQLLGPLCFLPALCKKPAGLLLYIPLLLLNLMTNYPYQHQIGYQYVFGPGSLLIYLAVVNYAELGPKRSKALLCAVLCSVVVFSGGALHRQDYANAYRFSQEYRQKVQEAISVIPSDASVVATTYFVPLLSQRDTIYELETTKHTGQYYVLDLRGHGYPEVQEKLRSDDYECLVYTEGVIAIYFDPNY